MPQCLKFSSVFTNQNNGVTYVVHFAESYPLDTCQHDVVMTNNEYATLAQKADDFDSLGGLVDDSNYDFFIQFLIVVFVVMSFVFGYSTGSRDGD